MKKSDPLAVSLQASAASISASSKRAGKQAGKSKSTPATGLCLPIDFLTPNAMKMSAKSARKTSIGLTASRQVSRAKTSPMLATLPRIARPEVCAGNEAASFMKSSALSSKYNPAGWSLKTSRRCSLPTMAKTLRQSSHPLPTAGIWDSGACLMLNISACPKDAVAFSWSQVLDVIPPLSSYMMPHQWSGYLRRLVRSKSHGHRWPSLGILSRQKTPVPGSCSGVKFLSLKRTDGIRWLSGSESLRYMGFASDWMRPTLQRLGVPETLCVPKLPGGSRKFSNAANAPEAAT